ncbi:hypothetical protein GW17_00010945 [Ensete ventricosum]|nr:hypothetical protein GW17_00010945 [Ensete ventricosum]
MVSGTTLMEIITSDPATAASATPNPTTLAALSTLGKPVATDRKPRRATFNPDPEPTETNSCVYRTRRGGSDRPATAHSKRPPLRMGRSRGLVGEKADGSRCRINGRRPWPLICYGMRQYEATVVVLRARSRETSGDRSAS